MNKSSAVKWVRGVGAAVIFLALWTCPGFCKDEQEAVRSAGSGFHIMALTRAVTEVPMFISFNGISDRFASRGAGEPVTGRPAVRLPLSGSGSGIVARLAKFKNCLFQYIQVSGMKEISGPGIGFPAAAVPGSEGSGSAGDISLEFQADMADKSGALLFVFQL
ncbi:MAG: hypothetical protein HUN04_01130 [Desulfobacter sp.]|nr:MAG: hypothetical protein HUN04_01130 [Desulfobacter sp.]